MFSALKTVFGNARLQEVWHFRHEQNIFGHPKLLWQLKKIIKFGGIRHLELKNFLGELPQTPAKCNPPFLIPWLRACVRMGSYVLLLIKNAARAIRPHNGNSSIHQVPTLSIFLALFYAHMHAMGHRAAWKQCSAGNLLTFFLDNFLRHFDGMDEESYAYLRVHQFFSK